MNKKTTKTKTETTKRVVLVGTYKEKQLMAWPGMVVK